MKQNKSEFIIMKFGGTSVGSPDAIKRLISIVISSKEPVAGVVVSAFSGITNELIDSANLASKGEKQYHLQFNEIAKRHRKTVKTLIQDEVLQQETLEHVEVILHELENLLKGIFLIKELSPKILDIVMSYGELLSAFIISQTFKAYSVQSEFVDTRKLIKTDSVFGNARVQLQKTYANITKYFYKKKDSIKIITGYIGSTDNDETTTFGRGGSDYTASIFGAAITAGKIEIWTDVDGVLTADPRKVPSAFTVKQLTYREAMEMSHFGAKVIYPQTMIPALTKEIPLVIRNTFNPQFAGTFITVKTSNDFIIKGITSIENVSLILVQGSGLRGTPGIAARLFGALAVQQINIILITQASSEYSICLAIDTKDREKAKKAIEDEFIHEMRDKLIDPLIIEGKLAIIAVVGEQMVNNVGFDGRLFTSLGNKKITIKAIALGSSERSVSFVIAANDEKKALQAVHKTFFGK